jgi:hypothetical protein
VRDDHPLPGELVAGGQRGCPPEQLGQPQKRIVDFVGISLSISASLIASTRRTASS